MLVTRRLNSLKQLEDHVSVYMLFLPQHHLDLYGPVIRGQLHRQHNHVQS